MFVSLCILAVYLFECMKYGVKISYQNWKKTVESNNIVFGFRISQTETYFKRNSVDSSLEMV